MRGETAKKWWSMPRKRKDVLEYIDKDLLCLPKITWRAVSEYKFNNNNSNTEHSSVIGLVKEGQDMIEFYGGENWRKINASGWKGIRLHWRVKLSSDGEPYWIFNAHNNNVADDFFIIISEKSCYFYLKAEIWNLNVTKEPTTSLRVTRQTGSTSLKFQKDASKAKIISHFFSFYTHKIEWRCLNRKSSLYSCHFGSIFVTFLLLTLTLLSSRYDVMKTSILTVIKFVAFVS
jgi:hypothetical protein